MSNGAFFIELRSRLLISLLFLFAILSICLYFANDLYTWLALPLLKFLPEGRLIATQIGSPFIVPFKLAFFVAMVMSMPFFLYQLWAFIAPALYGHERRALWPFLLMSIVLFYGGLFFAYLVIFPALFHFFAQTVPKGVFLSPDISEYLHFTTQLLLIFGALFEIPMAMALLARTGVVTCERFVRMRSYAIVGAFIVGMLLAPPDVISQTLLALPIWALYELGIVMARLIRR